MKRELRYAAVALRKRSTWKLAAWSVPEILPTAIYGVAVAHATDAPGRESPGWAVWSRPPASAPPGPTRSTAAWASWSSPCVTISYDGWWRVRSGLATTPRWRG
jgi:hypothetical protein